jgi:hypothetical protein
MASAWAHVASYGAMIIMSFIFAEKHYKVDYNMKRLIPYFVMAIGMVVFGKFFRYPNLFAELAINTVFIIIFIIYAQYKDKMLTVFLKREEK